MSSNLPLTRCGLCNSPPFYDQLYHGIELYSEYLGTRAPAWVYHDIYGRRRKHLTDPLQFLGFLYTPNLLNSLEQQLANAEKLALGDQSPNGLGSNQNLRNEPTRPNEKVRMRLALVRREFDYLKALAKVVHLYHAYQTQPDFVSRDRLLDAVDARNAYIDSLFAAPRGNPTPLPGFSFVLFPQLGHDAKHLRLNYDGYQEPFANSVMNWDTKVMRTAPLPGANRLVVKTVTGPISFDSTSWEQAAVADVARLVTFGTDSRSNQKSELKTTVRAMADDRQLHFRIETSLPVTSATDLIEVYLESSARNDAARASANIIYRFSVGPTTDSKQDAANGFNTDPLDPRFGKFDSDWSGEWTYQSKLDAERRRWLALISIPFKTLGGDAPSGGTFWRGNIARMHSNPTNVSQTERLLWSAGPNPKVLDDRNDFGEIAFESGKSPHPVGSK